MNAAPSAQPQHAALAAQRLADEEALGLRVVQAGGVELVELHVRHLRRPPGTPWPRRRRSRRPGWTCRGRPCPRRRWRAPSPCPGSVSMWPVRRERVDAQAPAGAARARAPVEDEIDGRGVLEEGDVRLRVARGEQGALHLAPGDVAGVDDAALRSGPPSRVRSNSPVARRLKSAPSVTSSRMRSGPSRTVTSTASRWLRPAPATRVSWMCSSKVSVGDSTLAMPPWA